MKKPKISLPIVLTSAFILFLTVFFLIRNHRHSPVQISALSRSEPSAYVSATDAETTLININTATRDELTTLPGIGETLANRIVAYRNIHGPFVSEDQLLNVEGIGSGKLRSILNLITIGGK